MSGLRHDVWWLRIGIAALALGLTAAIALLRPLPVQALDEGLRDMMVRAAAQELAETRVAVIDIDEQSLTDIGAWPWPRAKVADLVEILLLDQGARAVGLDIVFPQPADNAGDARLAALASHASLTLAQVLDYTPRLTTLNQGQLLGGYSSTPFDHAADAKGYIANHAGMNGARCVGNIGYIPDQDGTLRHIPPATQFDGRFYPSLAFAMLSCDRTDTPPVVVRTNDKGLWRIPYAVAQDAYTVISASEVMQHRVPHEFLKDRYVLVGSSALGLGDHVSTPLAPLTAGVMVHAAALSGLLDLENGKTGGATNGLPWLMAWCFITLTLPIWALPKISAWAGTVLITTQGVLWLALAYASVVHQIELPLTAPLWGYGVLLTVGIPFEWWQSQKHSRRLLNTLSHYVAHPVLDEIVRRGLQHSLEPSLKDVTVLVADMEGYTRLTSSMPLKSAAQLTKTFLDCLTRPILKYGGTLDKYSGDGLVAFWGAPLPCENKADIATAAALEILNEVHLLNQQRAASGEPPAFVRIGIESGIALVGDLGTDFRSTYTAVGDCINFASRLESAARSMGTPLLLGPAVVSELQGIETQELGTIHLRNTHTTIPVYTPKSLVTPIVK